jgi:cytochrome bd ubiquinol oxidase subunit I
VDPAALATAGSAAVLGSGSGELLAARWQMTLSLGSHIVLACFGVALPAMIYVLHRRGLRGDGDALLLAKRWSKVAAVLFAVGAVSGTILAFEMGLLWPGMMSTYGDVIGMPFALEGIAFFLEAIFLGVYLYGWGRLPGRVHLAILWPIIASGAVGTFCILSVNAWMNSPAGFRVVDGEIVDIDPLAAMLNDAVWLQSIHMFLAAYIVVGFCTAAVYAVGMLRGRQDRLHRLGFVVPFAFGTIAALAQPVTGHLAGNRLAEVQPAKLAAMELATSTEAPAPLAIGGVLIDGERRFAIEIPTVGSLFARNSLDAEILGLDEFAEDERPRDGLATLVHLSFQAMIGIGLSLVALSGWFWWQRRRGRDPLGSRRFLGAAVVAGPASVVALELGWVTTEVGRQPWIVQGHMRIDEAVTTSAGVWWTLLGLIVIYTAMGVGSVVVLRSMAGRWRQGEPTELPTPYGPPSRHGALREPVGAAPGSALPGPPGEGR